jgi:hypothetical protein
MVAVPPACPGPEQLPLIFFSPLTGKSFGKIRSVPATPAAAVSAGRLGGSCVAVLLHTQLATSSANPERPVVATCGTTGPDASQGSAVGVLSGFSDVQLQKAAGRLLEWERAPSETIYGMGGLFASDTERQDALSELLATMLEAGAAESATSTAGPLGDQPQTQTGGSAPETGGSAPVQPRTVFCESPMVANVMEILVGRGYVCAGAGLGFADFDYVLTAAGLGALCFGAPLRHPKPVMAPRAGVPLKDMSALHLLQTCLADGWVWQIATSLEQQAADPYKPGAAKLYYTTGVSTDDNYLKALLSAEKLIEGGAFAIPHGRPTDQYEAVLSGSKKNFPATHTHTSAGKRKRSALVLQDDVDVQVGFGASQSAKARPAGGSATVGNVQAAVPLSDKPAGNNAKKPRGNFFLYSLKHRSMPCAACMR